MRVEILHVAALPEAVADRWRALQALTPDFASPLVGPDFAKFVARYRPKAQVAIGYEGDLPVAFFAFHRARGGHAHAIGAPFCDYQAIVSDPSVTIDGVAFLARARIGSVAFTSLMDPLGLFKAQVADLSVVDGYRIDLSGGSAPFLSALWSTNPKWAKNIRRLTNKMDRELGPVRLVGHDDNVESFNSMMDIKVAQFRETGVTNVLRPKWVRAFMRDLFDLRGDNFGGCMVSLYSGEKFVAGHFGVRQGDWFHPWIASTCPLSHAYSPGIVFLNEMIRHADGAGLRIIDLSAGHGHYKGQFCRNPVAVLAGVVGDHPQGAPKQGTGALALIDRRLDLITAVEPDFLGQVTAIGMAIAAVPKRIIARQNRSDEA